MDIPANIITEIVSRALAEDLGAGDITSLATIPAEAKCQAEIVAKAEGIIAGLEVARAVFSALEAAVTFTAVGADGSKIKPGQVIARIAGPTHAVLAGERTALNFLQRMSGIATLTAQYVAAVAGTKTQILDTRKTAPGLRLLDKYAVRMGGGKNHRIGLFDGVLIKDNHIRAAGGIQQAVTHARATAHHLLKVEVETQSLTQVEEALAASAEVIMLDNMSLEQVREAVDLIADRAKTEVSGGITLETVCAYTECGVDYISVGALTHSVTALDISLEIL
jgi:nicotinate-nucleotide pyrophosphorylase (carboxylating)